MELGQAAGHPLLPSRVHSVRPGRRETQGVGEGVWYTRDCLVGFYIRGFKMKGHVLSVQEMGLELGSGSARAKACP